MRYNLDITSVIVNGGATIWTTKVPQSTGYMVSQHGTEKKWCLAAYLGDIEQLEAEMEKYVTRHYMDSDSVGFWVEDGHIYGDVSNHIESRLAAIAMGYAHHQLAIYDLANDTVISL